MRLCIFGAASNDIDQGYIDATFDFAKKLAERGHSLVFGAGKEGLMGAAARGFTAGGAEIIGVIPHFFDEFDVEVKYKKCTRLIMTNTMHERKAKMEDLADAFVIIPGGVGTFEEFFEVITLKQLGRHKKPIAIYNMNGYYDNLEALLDTAIEQGFFNEACRDIYKFTSDEEELIDYLENDKETELTLYELKKSKNSKNSKNRKDSED